MRSGDVFVNKEFVEQNFQAINEAQAFSTYARFSPRRIIIEKCREEFRYSKNTLPMDIWQAIIKVKNNLTNE